MVINKPELSVNKQVYISSPSTIKIIINEYLKKNIISFLKITFLTEGFVFSFYKTLSFGFVDLSSKWRETDEYWFIFGNEVKGNHLS